MNNTQRPVTFILISTNHGTMIVNRNDYRMTGENTGYGVGFQLLNTSSFDQPEIDVALNLLKKRREHFGEGVIAIDCGANIGVHTAEWAKLMYGWGNVISFEAQEKIYYALAGNITINNCLNVSARLSAVGLNCSSIEIPEINYLIPSSYGSLEIKKSNKNEFIGQNIDYEITKTVPLISIDSLGLKRLDFLKIDVEGMEEDVLYGAKVSIKNNHPIMLIEIIKSDKNKIVSFLEENKYKLFPLGINLLAIHQDDPTLKTIKVTKK